LEAVDVMCKLLSPSRRLRKRSSKLLRTDNDPNCKPWSSVSWAPPGYGSRKELEHNTHGAEDQRTLVEKKRGDGKAVGLTGDNVQMKENADAPDSKDATGNRML